MPSENLTIKQNKQEQMSQHVGGRQRGFHVVKIIGWGVDKVKNLPYWLVANSYNTDWGEKGLFRILRGSNECGIEEQVAAGDMKV
ncbi:unnamed protein product [Strongylus vulgaris]|uniref:Peptidase C1A papain C-terminal domain-containing protein n=1 Tax=Strongylus vulgaris TaxID=40348 RepID=A0A3P7IXD4_STRVU|nr:unnamed protein product [Strongylus vulgaris]